MADDRSSVKTRKRSGGWTVVEEPPVAPPPKIVATPSPTLLLSWEALYRVFSETIGNCLWRQFGAGEVDLTPEQRTAILERALDDLPLSIPSVQILLVELRKPNPQGWTLANSYSALVRIAEDYLTQAGAHFETPKLNQNEQQLLDRLNRRGNLGVS